MACTGRERLRWLLLAALSIGTTGIWVMHFIAMLGYTVPGQVIHYNVLITIASMLIAVVVVGIGLLIVGFGAADLAQSAAGRRIHRPRGRGHALHRNGSHAHAGPDDL